jgi:hypothetical protein
MSEEETTPPTDEVVEDQAETADVAEEEASDDLKNLMENALLERNLRSVVPVAAGTMHKLLLTLEEGDFVWWKFRGFNVFVGGDIGFALKKKIVVPSAVEGEDNSVMYHDIPWNGQNKTYRYSSATPCEGLWGPALQKCDVVLVWDNSYSMMMKKSVSYSVKVFKSRHDGDTKESTEEERALLTREDLVAFYQQHEPSKLSEIDAFIADYSSAVIVQTLIGKYDESPIALSLEEKDLKAFYEKHDPSKVKDAPKLMKDFDPNFLVKNLVQKYGDPSIIKRAPYTPGSGALGYATPPSTPRGSSEDPNLPVVEDDDDAESPNKEENQDGKAGETEKQKKARKAREKRKAKQAADDKEEEDKAKKASEAKAKREAKAATEVKEAAEASGEDEEKAKKEAEEKEAAEAEEKEAAEAEEKAKKEAEENEKEKSPAPEKPEVPKKKKKKNKKGKGRGGGGGN